MNMNVSSTFKIYISIIGANYLENKKKTFICVIYTLNVEWISISTLCSLLRHCYKLVLIMGYAHLGWIDKL